MRRAVVRAVTIFTLDIGILGGLWIVGYHRCPVADCTMWCFPAFVGNSFVKAVIFNITVITDGMTGGTIQAPVPGGIIDILNEDFRVP